MDVDVAIDIEVDLEGTSEMISTGIDMQCGMISETACRREVFLYNSAAKHFPEDGKWEQGIIVLTQVHICPKIPKSAWEPQLQSFE